MDGDRAPLQHGLKSIYEQVVYHLIDLSQINVDAPQVLGNGEFVANVRFSQHESRLMNPDIDGVEVTRQVRQLLQTTIIIVSVRGSEGDKIAALDAGANDYLVKPFAIGELLARIRAALPRTSQLSGEPVFNSLDLTVDLMSRRVTVGQKDVQLTSNEYGLLHLLITHVDRVLTHHYLLQGVWGSGYENDFHLLQVNISRLRVKIESDPAQPKLIITEPSMDTY